MKEKPPNWRVVEGSKNALTDHGTENKEQATRKNRIARVRKLSPALDQYLARRPTDPQQRAILLQRIYNELWALPAGGADTRNAASARYRQQQGERPRSDNFLIPSTDAELDWDEGYDLEFANAIGEKIEAVEEEERKLEGLEDYLTHEVEEAYRDDDSGPR